MDFRAESVYKMKRYVGNNMAKVQPENYASLSPIAGFIAPFIKEALTFAGVINPQPKHKYQETQYLFEHLTDMKDSIAGFGTKLKL